MAFGRDGLLGRAIASVGAWNRARRKHSGWIRTELRRNLTPKPDAFAVMGIMKNEALGIDEWVDHYLAIGATKAFLIDNGSTDQTLAKARAWAEKGCVEVVEYTEQHRQEAHYSNAFRHFRIGERFDWLAIADMDEFWFCKSGESMPGFLKRFPDVDVFSTNWSQFGSSGHLSQPDSVRCGFLMRDPALNRHTICILRTYVAKRPDAIRVHDVRGVRPSRYVTDNKNLQLNHYAIQSRDWYWNVKLARGSVFYAQTDQDALERRFEETDRQATFRDELLLHLLASDLLGKAAPSG